jgi:uncharacterized damage-inducible protein DinB
MNIRDIQLFFDYNYWANHLMLTTAAELSPAQLTQPTAFPSGNLHNTLLHTLDSEHMWRHLCQYNRLLLKRLPEIESFPTLDSIAAFWQTEEAEMRAFLNSLNDQDLENIVRYEVEGGVVRERVLWHCLVHVVNHGTQHRSECAAMLTDFGHSPGGIDMTLFMNLRGAGSS